MVSKSLEGDGVSSSNDSILPPPDQCILYTQRGKVPIRTPLKSYLIRIKTLGFLRRVKWERGSLLLLKRDKGTRDKDI